MKTREEQIQYECGYEKGAEEFIAKFKKKFDEFALSEIRANSSGRQQVEHGITDEWTEDDPVA